MIHAWLRLPLPPLFLTLIAFFGGIAALLTWLSFGRRTAATAQRFAGVVAPFIGAIAVVFAVLLGFLASDIWDRERRAATAVREEADHLLSLNTLFKTFGLPRDGIDGAIRNYVKVVVTEEWPSMASQQSSPEAEAALDRILATIDGLHLSGGGRGDLDRLMFDSAFAIRAARNTRLALSRDASEDVKWISVLVLAVMTQVSVALVHLERARPQIAAQAVLTVSVIVVIGLLAAHEQPFAPPLGISSDPIADVLRGIAG